MPKKTFWENDEVQFARLISEIASLGWITSDVLEELSDEMDLDADEIMEIVDRAIVSFDKVKETL